MLQNILLCDHTTMNLSTLLLPDIWVICRFLLPWAVLLWTFLYVFWCTCVRNPLRNTKNRVEACVTAISQQSVLQVVVCHFNTRVFPSHTWFIRLNYFLQSSKCKWPLIGFDLHFSDYYGDWAVSHVYRPFMFSLLWNACFVSIV